MKKFGKFLFGTVSLATLACGAYYLYKNFINKDTSDEFDDFEDECEDFDIEDEEAEVTDDKKKDTREYVSINITGEDSDQDSLDNDISETSSVTEDATES